MVRLKMRVHQIPYQDPDGVLWTVGITMALHLNTVLDKSRYVTKKSYPIGPHLHDIWLPIFAFSKRHMPGTATDGISIFEDGKVMN